MRSVFTIGLVLLGFARIAGADCAPACVGGGGPAATDCVVTFGGIGSTVVSCVDGAACDQDGAADGVCTFPLEACLGVDPACGVTAMTSVKVTPASLPAAATLAAGIQGLAVGACTTPGFAVPIKRTPAKLKPGKARLKVLT